MLLYLLNATAIWLISLISYDIFLKKESYHSYNRFYLLLTFLLGALLPLVQWQDDTTAYSGAFQKPIARVINAKQNIVAVTTPTNTAMNWQQWLLIVYVTGVVIALSLIVVDIMRLIAYYRNGKKSIQDGWTIICTGKEHAPFSFRNLLFVSSVKQYSADEWYMILAHEKRHTALLHIIDLLLMQAARIALWFHPLVYAYNKRLLLVHEYQADNAAAQQPQGYGKFLIEQALLQSAPSLAHSFNRSPIKKRIVMLTRKSSAAAKSKLLIFLPVLLVCIVCFTQNSYSRKPNKTGNFLHYKGNTIEFLAPGKPDSYMERDEVTGKLHRVPIGWPTPPIKVNGEKIYDPFKDTTVVRPVLTGKYKTLGEYILRNTIKEFEAMEDGSYFFLAEDVVVDAKGAIVYFNIEGVHRIGHDTSDQVKRFNIIAKKIDNLLDNGPAFEPAKVNGLPVAFLINSVSAYSFGYNHKDGHDGDVAVKDHKIVWSDADNQ